MKRYVSVRVEMEVDVADEAQLTRLAARLADLARETLEPEGTVWHAATVKRRERTNR